jgi:Coenzyme PQQ synthesis protein D (PqqD)
LSDTLWTRQDNWVGSQIEDAFVMLNFEGGEYVSLNSTATDIWNALEKPCTVDGIVGSLTRQYNIAPDRCAASVARVLSDFEAKGLIKAGA